MTNSPISPASRTISSWVLRRSSKVGSGLADFPVSSSKNETRRDDADPSECDDDGFRPFDVTSADWSGRLWLDSRRVGPVSWLGAKVTRDVRRLEVSESLLATDDVVLNRLFRMMPVGVSVSEVMLNLAHRCSNESIEILLSVIRRFDGG